MKTRAGICLPAAAVIALAILVSAASLARRHWLLAVPPVCGATALAIWDRKCHIAMRRIRGRTTE